jgi:hypothetical protein
MPAARAQSVIAQSCEFQSRTRGSEFTDAIIPRALEKLILFFRTAHPSCAIRRIEGGAAVSQLNDTARQATSGVGRRGAHLVLVTKLGVGRRRLRRNLQPQFVVLYMNVRRSGGSSRVFTFHSDRHAAERRLRAVAPRASMDTSQKPNGNARLRWGTNSVR